jgi:hypothetical protein
MGALLVLWLRPAPAEMAPFFTGPDNVGRVPIQIRCEDLTEHATAHNKAATMLRKTEAHGAVPLLRRKNLEQRFQTRGIRLKAHCVDIDRNHKETLRRSLYPPTIAGLLATPRASTADASLLKDSGQHNIGPHRSPLCCRIPKSRATIVPFTLTVKKRTRGDNEVGVELRAAGQTSSDPIFVPLYQTVSAPILTS